MAKKKQRINLIDRNGNSQVVQVNSSDLSDSTKSNKKTSIGSTIKNATSGGIAKKIVTVRPSGGTNEQNERNYGPLVNASNTNTVTPTIRTSDINANLDKKENQRLANRQYNEALSNTLEARNDLSKKAFNEMKEQGAETDNRNLLSQDKRQLSYETKNKGKTAKDIIEENNEKIAKASENTKEKYQKEIKDLANKENELTYAKYQKDYWDVQNDDIDTVDKTLGIVPNAIADYFSSFTRDQQTYTDNNGNELVLPTKSEMKREKTLENIKNPVGRWLYQVGHEGTKQALTQGLNMSGLPLGSMLYYGDILTDTHNENLNSGENKTRSIIDAVAKTGQSYIKQKILGGIGGKLTGNNSPSWLENTLTKQFGKFIQNPAVTTILGSATAEGIDEFTDSYIEKALDAAILSDNKEEALKRIKEVFSIDALKEAFYEGSIGAGTGAIGNIDGAIDAGKTNRFLKQNGIDIKQARQIAQTQTAEDIQKSAAEGTNEVMNQVRQGNITEQQGQQFLDTIQRRTQAILDLQQSMQGNQQNTLESKLEIVQNLNDVEKSKLVEVTQKMKSGQQLDIDDIATLDYLNSKGTPQAAENAPISNETTQPNAIPQETQNNTQSREINNNYASQDLEGPPVEEERTPYSKQMTQEEADEMQRAHSESLDRMADGRVGRTPGEQLIEDNNVSDRRVNAIQYDNPEIKKYYKQAAEVVGAEAYDAKNQSFQSGIREQQDELGRTEYRRYAGWNGFISKDLSDLARNNHLTAKQIEKAANDIIEDNGKENNANAKKLEKVLDKRLREGYSAYGDNFEPNQDYINEMENIAYEKQRQGELESLEEGSEAVKANETTQNNKQESTENSAFNLEQNIENQTKQENIPDKVEEQVIKIGNKEIKSTDKESKLEKELTPEELRDLKIKEVKENLEAEYDEENIPKILRNTELAKEKTPTKEKIKNLETIGKMLYGKLVDKGEALAEIGRKTGNKELYPTYDKSLLYRGIAQYQIGNAQTNLDGNPYNNFVDKKGKNVSMSWDGIYKDANNVGINDNVLDEYLVAQLNIDRLNQGINQFNIPESVSQETIARLEQEHPEIKRIAENVYTYSRNRLNKMVESGLVSQETADEFNQKFPHYVRIQRDVKKGKGSLVYDKQGKVSVDSGIQRVKGGNYDILPIKETAANYEIQLAKAMGLNEVGLQLEKSLATPVDSNGKINKISENGELLDFDPNKDTILGDAVAKGADGNYTFTIWMDGAPVRLQIDARIYEALKTNRQSWLEQKITQPTLGRVASWQRALLTDKNPIFLATNFLKDIGDAPLNSKYGTVEFFKNYGVAMNEIRKGQNSKLWQLYLANGGLQNSYFENMQFNDTGKNKAQKKVGAIAESISKANNVIEQLPRFAEFITTLNHGGSLSEAMYNSAEITTNFKRGGNITKTMNRNGFNFLNASVQGFDKQIRNFAQIGTNRKGFVKFLAKATIYGMVPALTNDLMYDDDDEYKELQDYVKDQYFLIKGKNGTWIRIPKGRAMSIFGAAARRTKELASGNKDAFKDFGQLVSNQIAPNNPLDNNILSPFVAVANNKSWSGNKIVSDYEEKNYAPEDQYDNNTDKLSIWLGKKLKKSPKMINYLLDQYTGGIGDIALPAMTNKAKNNVLKDKFTTDAIMKSKTTGEFYDALYDASKAKNHLKKEGKKDTEEYQEKNKVYSYLYNASLNISELKGKQDEIQGNDNLSKKEKYEKVKEIQKEINEEMRKAIENSKDVERTDEYIRVGDVYYDKKTKKDGTTEYKKRKQK